MAYRSFPPVPLRTKSDEHREHKKKYKAHRRSSSFSTADCIDEFKFIGPSGTTGATSLQSSKSFNKYDRPHFHNQNSPKPGSTKSSPAPMQSPHSVNYHVSLPSKQDQSINWSPGKKPGMTWAHSLPRDAAASDWAKQTKLQSPPRRYVSTLPSKITSN